MPSRRRKAPTIASRSAPNLAGLQGHHPSLAAASRHEPSIVIHSGTPRATRIIYSTSPAASAEEEEEEEEEEGGEEVEEEERREEDEDEDEEEEDVSSSSSSSSVHDADFQSHHPLNAAHPSPSSSSSASSSERDDRSPAPLPLPLPLPLPFRRSTSSLLIPTNAFAPPFYNRPPTPLPPSPSLTSLLRPSFSSRPTTPDDSDNDTEAAVAKSARTATTVPRASPKVPTYEYYGFVLYLTSSLSFLMYILWSYLPSPFLHQLGIHYYPNRWWSLALPAFLSMTVLYIYVALAAYNTGYLTLPLSSVENIVDEAANVAAVADVRKKGRGANEDAGRGKDYWKSLWSEGTDAVMDVPIGGVCEVLYGEG